MDCSTSELPGGKQKGEALTASQQGEALSASKLPLHGPVLSARDDVTSWNLELKAALCLS